MHSCANAQARATLVPMTQVPNLANLNLGIPTAGRGKKGRAAEKKESGRIAQQRERDLKWHRDIFVQCRNAALNEFSVNRLETPDQIGAFLARVVRNEYLNAFVRHWLKGDPDHAISWAMRIWDRHYAVLKLVRLDNPTPALLGIGLTPWDPPTYPLTMEHAINDKLNQVANILFDVYIARAGPNGAERSPADIGDMLNDPVHAELLMLLAKDAFLAVLHYTPDDPFLVQTHDYWVDLEKKVLVSGDIRRLSRGPVVANEEQEQVLAPCALPPCIRPPPRPVAGVEEQEEEERDVVHHPSDDERNPPDDDELPLTFVRRGMRQLRM